MLPSVTGLSLSALRSAVPTEAGVNDFPRPSFIDAHMYVHTDDGAIYDFKLKVWEEFVHGGTFVDTTGQFIISILNRDNVSMIRVIGEHYLVFTIEEPGELRKLSDFSADSDPLTLEANYGTKVKVAPYGRHGLKLDVTPRERTL